MLATDDAGERLIPISSLADDVNRMPALDVVRVNKIELKSCRNVVKERVVPFESYSVPSNLWDLYGGIFKSKLPALPWYQAEASLTPLLCLLHQNLGPKTYSKERPASIREVE